MSHISFRRPRAGGDDAAQCGNAQPRYAAATGASLAELMERLGHSTPQAAMRYQHAAKGRGREIAALLTKLSENG